MERRRGKKKQLKWRILKHIALILAVSMTIASLTGFWYFERVVREQKISDERSGLMQVSGQLAFMAEDIRQFAKSILIDEELQGLLGEDVSGGTYQKKRRGNKAAARLVFYGSLRSYIKHIWIRMKDGACYGSGYEAIDTEYIHEKLTQGEIAAYAGRKNGSFSKPYTDGTKEKQMICFQMDMFDKYHFGQNQGTLYMEFELGYFLEPIRSYAGAESYAFLLGDDGDVLYGQDPDGRLSDCIAELAGLSGEIRRIKNGYLVCDEIEGTDFRFGTLVTDQYLWERSSFVLWFFLCSFLFSVSLILIFISRLLERLIRPVTELSARMETASYGSMEPMEAVHTGDEIETLYHSFDHMITQLKKGEEERIRNERQKHQMEYDITLSQIHPHYLYNVLNTVVYLAAAGKNQDVASIVHALIDTLHHTLEIGGDHVETTVEKEIMLTNSYLDIQKYRYPDMVTAQIRCGDALKACRVPRIVIQPLVENAILHGILPAERAGTVSVDIFKKDEALFIVVEDDGIGMEEERLKQFWAGEEILSEKGGRRHIGLQNVRDRIGFLYGKEYGMGIERRKGGGTRVKLKLPLLVMLFLLCACNGADHLPTERQAGFSQGNLEETPYSEPLPADYRGTLTMWGWDDDYYRTVTEAFQEKYPNVSFAYTAVAHKDLPQKYETALISGGELPDIAWSVIDSRGEVFELDMWEPLQQEPYCFDITEIYEYMRPRMVNTKGDVCGIEQSLSPAGLAYRRDLAKQYLGTDDPKELEAMLPDWDSFIEKGKEVYKKSGGSVYMWFSLSDLRQFIQEQQGIPWANGGTIHAEDTFGRSLNLACRFRDEHISDSLAAWTPAWNAAFNEDGHIFTTCATWTVQFTIQSSDKKGETKGHWGLMSAPEGNANLGGTAMGITRTCKDKRLAWEFLRFATLSAEGAKAINRIGLLTTAQKPYEEAPGLKSYQSPWFGEQDLGVYYMEKIVPHIKARTLTPQDGVVHDSLNMVLEVINADRGVGYEEALGYLKEELRAELKGVEVY